MIHKKINIIILKSNKMAGMYSHKTVHVKIIIRILVMGMIDVHVDDQDHELWSG